MSLDERGLNILKLPVNNPTVSGSQLKEEAGLSRKQLSYFLAKTNFYLKENKFEEIERMWTGELIIPRNVINSYEISQFIFNEGVYVFMEEERLCLTALILLRHREELSINHFTSILRISKNAALNGLKKLQTVILQEFDLKLWYDHSKGYHLVGKEYEKRALMIRMIRSILPLLGGESILLSIFKIDEERVRMLYADAEGVEGILKVHYTDERIQKIPFILYFILIRIETQKFLDVLLEDYQRIAGTSKYGSIMNTFARYSIRNIMDELYLISQLQMSSINFEDSRSKEFEKELAEAAEKTLGNFGNFVYIRFQNRKALLDALVQHLKPVLYGIRYQYYIESSILSMMLPHHSYLPEITGHAMAPFEEMSHILILQEEMVYITILFGGRMTKGGTLDFLEKGRRAIVACTSGISISSFLFLKLKEALPELKFLCSLSLRQFYGHHKEYDVVLVTVHLDTTVPQFLIKPIMDDNDLHSLRKKVFSGFLNRTTYEVNSASLLHVISKHVDVKDRKGLLTALKSHLGETTQEMVLTEHCHQMGTNNLYGLLTPETAHIAEHELAWTEVIRTASEPLLRSDCTATKCIENMIYSVKYDKPIWTIVDDLLLVYTSVEGGVNALGMPLLKLPGSICLSGYMEAVIAVVMATLNRETHLKALYALIGIVGNGEDFNRMKSTDSILEILDVTSKERCEVC